MRELERKDDAIMDNYEYYDNYSDDNDQKRLLLTSDPLNDNSKKPGPPYEGERGKKLYVYALEFALGENSLPIGVICII